MKRIGLLRKVQPVLPQTSLVTICKLFIRPYFDYGDVICDQPLNESFFNSIETVQYNAALASTGTTKGTSRKKSYRKLGPEYLQQRR